MPFLRSWIKGRALAKFYLTLLIYSRLSQLTADFEKQFSHPSISSLPEILSTLSTSSSKQDSHFFASVVRSKDLIPLYHDVVLWMLKRDMLITLHLRIRVVATQELKLRVRLAKDSALKNKKKSTRKFRGLEREMGSHGAVRVAWLSLSPTSARKYSQRIPSTDSAHTELSELDLQEEEDSEPDGGPDDDEEPSESEDEGDDSGLDVLEDNLAPSMINDPGRATPLQRRWLSAMSDGKEPYIARRFEQ